MQKVVPAKAVLIPEKAECVFHGVIYDVYQWEQELYDGSNATFEMLRRPDSVATIAIDGDQILIVRDQQPNRPHKLAFPGGRMEATDVSVMAAAQRELLEESGYSFADWRLVQVKQPHTKIEWFVHIWLAQNKIEQMSPKHDSGEQISLQKISFDELKALMKTDSDYVKESADLLKHCDTIDALKKLPEFQGQVIER